MLGLCAESSAHHSGSLVRFFARKTSLSTDSGFEAALWQVTTLPLMLKALSERELVAGNATLPESSLWDMLCTGSSAIPGDWFHRLRR